MPGLVYSQLHLRQTRSGPAPTVRLREVSALEGDEVNDWSTAGTNSTCLTKRIWCFNSDEERLPCRRCNGRHYWPGRIGGLLWNWKQRWIVVVVIVICYCYLFLSLELICLYSCILNILFCCVVITHFVDNPTFMVRRVLCSGNLDCLMWAMLIQAKAVLWK